MSYATRVYRQRNAHTPDEKNDEAPFFTKSDKQADHSKTRQPFFQTKLDVGEPNDQYEKEADAVADSVVNNKAKSSGSFHDKKINSIQRLATPKEEEKFSTNEDRMKKDKDIQQKREIQAKCDSCENEEEDKPVQRMNDPEKDKEKMNGAVQKMDDPEKERENLKGPVEKMDPNKERDEMQSPVQKMDEPTTEEEKDKKPGVSAVQTKSDHSAKGAPGLSSRLEQNAGKGRALPEKTREEMQSSFGHDFSDVNIHTGAEAVEMNRELGAQAFTHGRDIYFNSGKYNPESSNGKHLLAHELTHTVQQTDQKKSAYKHPARVQRKIGDGHDLKSPRFAGDELLEKAFDDERHLKFGDTNEAVKKIQQAMIDTGIEMPISTRKTGSPDGIFLSETAEAVKAFQRKCGLKGKDVDGIVGPITMGLFDARFPSSANTGPVPSVPTTKKVVTVNITRLHGSTKVPSRSLAFANTIFLPQANIEIVIGSDITLGEKETMDLIGNDEMLEMHFFDKASSAEEKALFKTNQSSGAIAVYFVKEISETDGKVSKEAVGYSIMPSHGFGFLGIAIGNSARDKTLAHELGHMLGREKHHTGDENLLMTDGGPGNRLTADDIKVMREDNKFAK